jgi:Ca2+-binding RTX toxin-like protein
MRYVPLQTRQLAECQQLEPRIFLAAAFAELTSRGTLLINGTDDRNQITVTALSGAAQITAAMDGSTLQFPLLSVKRVYIDCRAGDDAVTVNAKVSASIRGGDGNDRLIGGPLADLIDGGPGDDTINGEGGKDVLIGGDGVDTADYSDRDRPMRIGEGGNKDANENYTAGTLSAGPADPVAGEEPGEDRSTDLFEIVIGTRFNDILSGGPRAETTTVTIRGGSGDDTFEFNTGGAYFFDGGSGRDYFAGGGDSATTFSGGAGYDYFVTNRYWTSIIDGGPGRDTLDNANSAPVLDLNLFKGIENLVNAAGQLVIGTDAANYIAASPSSGAPVTLRGNGGNDTIIGSLFADSLIGGDGDDVISAGGGNDTIYGGNGNDVINGNSGNDRIYGGSGNDTLIGGPGRDRLYGEAGDDLLGTRDHKIDTLYGGDGSDSAKLDHKTVNDLYHEIEKLL